MTHDEVAAVQQRTRDEWEKYQKACGVPPRRRAGSASEKNQTPADKNYNQGA